MKMRSLNANHLNIIGDIHGDATAIAQWGAFYKGKFLIVAGDAGLLFGNENNLEILNIFKKRYSDKVVLIVPGNHDDYDQIEALPQCEKFGGKLRKLSNQFYYVERGEILTICDKKILCVSGADSIDIGWRITYEHLHNQKIWWQQEQITASDINKIIDRMPHHGWRVDYVVSHDLPTPIKREAFHGVLYGPHSSSDLLWDLANQIDFSAWYGAHLHLSYNSMIGDKEFIVLNINEIQEVF